MTSTRVAPAPSRSAEGGGLPARRAVMRWAWRMLRREWRQQLLVLGLLTIAVATTTVGAGLAANARSSDEGAFGTANYLITLPGSDPNLTADIEAAKTSFGNVEVIQHQKVAVPGSVNPIDLRAQDPLGPYSHPTLRLDAGRYPTGSNEVAVTAGVATIFHLHVGDTWERDGRVRAVVGLVENPSNLLDQFALVAPGQASPPDNVTMLVEATAERFDSAPSINGGDVEVRPPGDNQTAALQVLVLATIGLLFIGLVAVAGFTVMAQRRLRALGMLGAIGATDRHVRQVLLANGAAVGITAAVVGTAAGLAGWFIFAPHLERLTEHRIDRFNLPWWAIATGMLLAVGTAIAAAWWPARSAARIPIVAALSGRPARPRPANRFAAVGGLLLLTGVGSLAFSHRSRPLLIVTGIVATTLGILLLAPVGIAGLSAAGRRSPIATRLALRDLARYQARSGAALAAVSLAVGIAAAIVVAAGAQAASVARPTGGNLPTNELLIWLPPEGLGGGLVPAPNSQELQTVQSRVNGIAATLHTRSVLTLEVATDPTLPDVTGGPGNGPGGKPVVALGKPIHVVIDGRDGTSFSNLDSVELFVATPAVLERYGVDPGDVEPTTDILTSRSTLAGLELIPGRYTGWQPKIQIVSELPSYTSDPTTLITAHALRSLGFTALPAGWLIRTPQPLTAAQIDQARQLAVAAGVSVESRTTQASLSRLRTDATGAGVLVALGVLAMTVGLIRSETAGDLRTLAATGATSTTRRTLTGATAGSLALLGALLGTAGAYAAIVAWDHDQLHLLRHVPVADLTGIVVGLPVVAAATGWLLAGREPPVIARQPLE
jgi:putative ABC transport system permease protein